MVLERFFFKAEILKIYLFFLLYSSKKCNEKFLTGAVYCQEEYAALQSISTRYFCFICFNTEKQPAH